MSLRVDRSNTTKRRVLSDLQGVRNDSMALKSPPVDSEKLFEIFMSLVQIPSPSGQEEKVCQYLQGRFNALAKELPGLTYEVVQGGNLIVHIPSNRAENRKTLVMTGHMDVVSPCTNVRPEVRGTGEGRTIHATGGNVLGADGKSAFPPMLESLEMSIRHNLPRPALIYAITTREEQGLQGVKEINPAIYKNADFAIAFDHTGKQGTMIYQAPTSQLTTVTVNGQEAHGGIDPENGASAIEAMGRGIAILGDTTLNRYRRGRFSPTTTVNVGTIKGGTARNVVPGKAIAQIDVRSHSSRQVAQVTANINIAFRQASQAVPGTSYAVTPMVLYEHYKTSRRNPHVQLIKTAMNTLEIPYTPQISNGGSDVNVFVKNGLPSVVLSSGFVNPHQPDKEWIALNDMVSMTQLTMEIWKQFALCTTE